jgi:hypothetical protein
MLFRRVALTIAVYFSVATFAHADDAITARFSPHTASSATTVDHGAWDAILKANIVAGADGINRLTYARMAGTPAAAIKRYIKTLETVAVATLDRPEQQAFWVNLYNAVTLDAVLDRYPVKSIYDVGLKDAQGVQQDGPWKAKLVTIGGTALSLDDIENAIIRPIFKDGRAHYALNCLSIGCPNMPPLALTGANLEATYEAGSRAFVNHPRAISFGTDGKVTASSIYDWFAVDFGGFAGVVAHLQKYAGPDLKAKLTGLKTIDIYAYDWALADAAP